MKIIIFFAMCLMTHGVMAEDKDVTPLSVVNARMDAYNNHDIRAFLKNYSKDIQVSTYPNVSLGNKGKEHLKDIFEPMFKEGNVSVKVHQQITQGKYVINHETVTNNGKGQKYVSIYEVKDGFITSVQFVRE
jgi:hypothetical protein